MRKIPIFTKWHVPPPITHLLVWLFIFLVPVILLPALGSANAQHIHHWVFVLFIVILIPFYANYSYLIPKLLFKRHFVVYVAINLAMFFLLSCLLYLWREYAISMSVIKPPPLYKPGFSGFWLVKSIANFMFVGLIAVAVSSTSIWFKSKETIQKLELESVRSELLFLKTQISPHFLFNTLNNILALIDENKELAKESVQQLSKLLRSVIYDSQDDTVSITREVEFLTNYSNLMKLRYGQELKFSLEANLAEPEAPIAPLLLIPILENVFKHGIGASLEDSFINIKITSEKGKIIFESENSYFPKTPQDKSGSGIGIANMQKRLDLLYESRYFYDCKIVSGKYITKLEINFELSG